MVPLIITTDSSGNSWILVDKEYGNPLVTKLIQLHKLSILLINLRLLAKCWLHVLCSSHCSYCASSDNSECGYCDKLGGCYSVHSVVFCYKDTEDKKQVKTTISWVSTYSVTLHVGTATKLQALDEVPVRDNPAYQLVSLQKSHHQSASTSMHVTTPPTHQASPQYENIVEVDEKCGGDDNKHNYENMKEWLTWSTCNLLYHLWSGPHFLLSYFTVSSNINFLL